MTDAEPPPTGPTLTPAASAGSTPAGGISIRPLEADDAHRLQDLARRVSPTSGYFRFFVPMPTLREPLLTHLVSVDHQNREALAAVAGDQVCRRRAIRPDADRPQHCRNRRVGRRRLAGPRHRAATPRGVGRSRPGPTDPTVHRPDAARQPRYRTVAALPVAAATGAHRGRELRVPTPVAADSPALRFG